MDEVSPAPIRVLALMKYGRAAASTRQRLEQYRPYLAAHDVEVEISSLLGDDHLHRLAEGRRSRFLAVVTGYLRRFLILFKARRYDVIYIHMDAFPYLPSLFERLVHAPGRPVVYDFDDAAFHIYDIHPNPLVRRFLSRKLDASLKRAAAVMCGNDYLANYVRRLTDRAHIVPTVVDTSRYMPRATSKDGPIVLGWIGSPSTWKFVQDILPELVAATRAHGAILRVVGAGRQAEGLDGVDAVTWSEAEEIASLQSMDVGIMPLTDQPWERGKCGYKLVQYMACGLPVVASPVGVNVDIVENGQNGFLASNWPEWRAALDELLDDAALRHRLGAAGRARIEATYSLNAQQGRILELLRAAAGKAVHV